MISKSMILSMIMMLLLISVAGAEENNTITVTDDLGRQVSITSAPQRIVSLSPSNTEMLFALGLGDRVVGVTKYCNYPPEVESLKDSGMVEVVGGYVDPDFETILSLRPDLVLTSRTHSSEAISLLDKESIPIFVVDPNNLSRIILSIEKIGKITEKEVEASELCNRMKSRIRAVSDTVSSLPKTRVLYIVWHDPVRTAGAGTFEDEVIEKAGGVNIFHDLSGYALVDPEAIAMRNPEVIIACSGMGTGADKPIQWAETERGLNLTLARKNGRIYQAEGDIITRAGPRIVDGLEMFAKFIHPEAF
ncbi:MAG: cobalamin-binding protein [Methanothrix sp.]|nr:cobalamin-binding protein [Methanothrix sp.]